MTHLDPAAYHRTPADIIVTVSKALNCKPHDIIHSRLHIHTLPRHIAMHLIYKYTPHSLPQTGRVFGRHHSTVIHAIKRVEAMRQDERDDKAITKLERAVYTPNP